MYTFVENGHCDLSSKPGRDCISHAGNILRKIMNPIILSTAIGQTGFFNIGRITGLGEEKH